VPVNRGSLGWRGVYSQGAEQDKTMQGVRQNSSN
jgi:hypothetical protein